MHRCEAISEPTPALSAQPLLRVRLMLSPCFYNSSYPNWHDNATDGKDARVCAAFGGGAGVRGGYGSRSRGFCRGQSAIRKTLASGMAKPRRAGADRRGSSWRTSKTYLRAGASGAGLAGSQSGRIRISNGTMDRRADRGFDRAFFPCPDEPSISQRLAWPAGNQSADAATRSARTKRRRHPGLGSAPVATHQKKFMTAAER